MDFNQLMAKMRELDTPVQECGEPMGLPPMGATPPVAPPSMSVNLNAQGMENIEDLLKLITKVNPDMGNQPSPEMNPLDMLTPPGPSISKPELPPLKMLPDFDKDEPEDSMDQPGDDKMNVIKIGGDDTATDDNKIDKFPGDEEGEGDEEETDETRYSPGEYGGEHDPDPEPEPKGKNPFPFADDEPEDEEKDEGTDFQNATTRPNEKEYGIDAVTHNGTDLNREKDTFPKVAGGDNPMQKPKFESGDLRSQIRAELLQRLAEAKGAK